MDTMDSSNPQCTVRQCFHCEESTVFFCSTCNQNLCGPCKWKHLHDLSTANHKTVAYRDKRRDVKIEDMCRLHPENTYIYYCKTCKLPVCYECKWDHEFERHSITSFYSAYKVVKQICCTIKSEELLNRAALMIELQSDIKKLNSKMSSHKHLSKMITKSQKIKQLIDIVVHDRNKYLSILQNQIMKSHIARLQKNEYRYEKSARKPTQFISFLKTTLSNIEPGPNLAQSSIPPLTESINDEDVIRLLCTLTISDSGKRRLGNGSVLKLMSYPELQQRLMLTDTSGCLHISRDTQDQDQFWVSDNRNNLILFNKNGDIQKHLQNEIYTHVYDLIGAHTVDRSNYMIYIDTNNQIKRVFNKEINTLYIKDDDNQWIYRCVYSSMLTGNLLIGMSNEDSNCSKIARHHWLGHLLQTIQYDTAGHELYFGPCYITENNNGDVIVSDWKKGVVVTDNEGRHRFTFTEDPYGYAISPKGICTDPFSHILVCVLHKVMMLDMDGQFISYILSMPPECMIVTNSLSFDSNTHCLWVGSVSSETIRVYKYLKRFDALLGMYASDYYLK